MIIKDLLASYKISSLLMFKVLWSLRNRRWLNHFIRLSLYLFLRGCNFMEAIIKQRSTLFYYAWIILNCWIFNGAFSHYRWAFLWNYFSWSYFNCILDDIRWSRSIYSLLRYRWRNNRWRDLKYSRLRHHRLRNRVSTLGRRLYKYLRMRVYIH